MTDTNQKGDSTQEGLLRLPDVLELIPVSKSTWWEGVKEGRFPKSIKLGAKTTVWSKKSIINYIHSLEVESNKVSGEPK